MCKEYILGMHVHTAHETGNKTLARQTRASREGLPYNAIAREGYRALESLISLLARQYNSRVVPRELSSFARECMSYLDMPCAEINWNVLYENGSCGFYFIT